MNSVMQTAAEKEAPHQLYFILLMLCEGPAMDVVANAGEREGLEAWRMLVRTSDRRIRSSWAGQLLGIMDWDFKGDVVGRLEEFEGERWPSTRSPARRQWLGTPNAESYCGRWGTNHCVHTW